MFAEQIGKMIEVYVDKMLVKSLHTANHLTHLTKICDMLYTYNMKPNPYKCAFGISFRKFLGFMINQKGIEMNLDKIKAMLGMEAP